MKVLSRMVVKVPRYRENVPIRYELELQQDQVEYRVVRYQYKSNKLCQREQKIVTICKLTAIEHYKHQILLLSTYLL